MEFLNQLISYLNQSSDVQVFSDNFILIFFSLFGVIALYKYLMYRVKEHDNTTNPNIKDIVQHVTKDSVGTIVGGVICLYIGLLLHRTYWLLWRTSRLYEDETIQNYFIDFGWILTPFVIIICTGILFTLTPITKRIFGKWWIFLTIVSVLAMKAIGILLATLLLNTPTYLKLFQELLGYS